ncbi:LysE family translocator [Xenorhabdus bovienii]|uniref:LysE family translocator n=1 Tax=Xenorhabdus bovienii TaxID=40576 RepID=UPI0023B342D1|nr:LysE family translocator [Xenorhabdus bovienii]MDE9492047.1 LysE family translocator [Xenorhabdus bovienii]MDE9500440.1 LysE family translocator [Xenorhabdus bovienii]MDE9524231.1 LysE family translocator [Xenorhabdus bovienii]MDE9567482.1 LysE family translocator [Xenorhabdus bovienii]
MSTNQEFIIDFCTILLIGVISPGPGFLVTIKNAIAYPKSVVIMSVIGIATANALFAILAFSGLILILKEPVILSVIYILGGTYLLYLSYRLFLTKPIDNIEFNNSHDKKDCTFKSGFLLQISNPKALIFISSAISVSVPPSIDISISAIMILISFIISLLWYGGVAMIINYQKIRNYLLNKIHIVNRLSSLVIFIMSIKIYYSAIHLM